MIFSGHTELSIDAKQRLAIPARYRQRLSGKEKAADRSGGSKPTGSAGPKPTDPADQPEAPDGPARSWYCIPWPTGIIRVYPAAMFEELSRDRRPSLSPREDEAELDLLHSFAEQVDEDGQGRIMLPRKHLELTGLYREGSPKEVVVIGARTRLEIIDRAAWSAGLQERFARLPSIAEKVQARLERDEKR